MKIVKFYRFMASLRIANENMTEILKDLIQSEIKAIERAYKDAEDDVVYKYMCNQKLQEKNINAVRREKRAKIKEVTKHYNDFHKLCKKLESGLLGQDNSTLDSITEHLRNYVNEHIKEVRCTN
jgi:hypothetical protein